MLKERDVSLRSATSAPAPNAGSTLIEALVAVKVFEVEEKKPELIGGWGAKDPGTQGGSGPIRKF